jgi:hypothetical protein
MSKPTKDILRSQLEMTISEISRLTSMYNFRDPAAPLPLHTSQTTNRIPFTGNENGNKVCRTLERVLETGTSIHQWLPESKFRFPSK